MHTCIGVEVCDNIENAKKGENMQLNEIRIKRSTQENIINFMPKEKTLRALADFFSVFSDETRIKIITALAISEMCVGDIAKVLELNQTTVSHQLKHLRNIGAVNYRRDGKVLYYSLLNKGINDCLMSGVNYIMGE